MNVDYDEKRRYTKNRWDRCTYRKTNTLKNHFGIRDKAILQEVEANYTMLRLRQLVLFPVEGNFDYTHFTAIHKHIFQDLYDWAGKPRKMDMCKTEHVLGGRSIEYACHKEAPGLVAKAILNMTSVDWHGLPPEDRAAEMALHMAAIWKLHLFRDGNTRTMTHFCLQYADHVGMHMDYLVLSKYHGRYRDALALASADHTTFSDRQDREPLIAIVREAMDTAHRRRNAEPEPEPAEPEPEPAEPEPELECGA